MNVQILIQYAVKSPQSSATGKFLLNRRNRTNNIVEEINSAACNNSFPYIAIKNPPSKLPLDTDCFKSLIRPSAAEKCFTEKIYHEPCIIKTDIGEKLIRLRAKIPAVPELTSDVMIEFLLFDFYGFFEGTLGSGDILKKNWSIDLETKNLVNNSVKIPFTFTKFDVTYFTLSVDSYESLNFKVPVHCCSGNIIITEKFINGLYTYSCCRRRSCHY